MYNYYIIGGDMGQKCIDLQELNKKVLDEINDYKWLESEKKGYDIGDKRAATEWINKFYPEWFRIHFN